jgi:hypothetical protein
LKAREDFPRVTAVTERAIHREFAGSGHQRFQNFRDHDGSMAAGGGFAGSEHFGDGVRVTLRIVLLIFLLEATRISA